MTGVSSLVCFVLLSLPLTMSDEMYKMDCALAGGCVQFAGAGVGGGAVGEMRTI